MILSAHFTLEEFIDSQTAARKGIDNTPPPEVMDRLHRTATGLELVRNLLQAPILISSGYRSPELNAAVGGSKNSQHMTGEAVDFTCPGFGPPAKVVQSIVQSIIPFDQVIVEFGRWVHISFAMQPRKMALVIDADGTRAWA